MPTDNVNTYIYIHVCCIKSWKLRLTTLLSKIKESGLYEQVKEIRCGILGDYSDSTELFNDPKIVILYNSFNIKLYEVETLKYLYEDSKKEDFNVLYLHTKGVIHDITNKNVNDWIEYISYFNIYKGDLIKTLLKAYDTVGVNLQGGGEYDIYPIHYSGNFWWSKSQYIRKLKIPENLEYNSPEFWLTEKKLGYYVVLWESNIKHYAHTYDSKNYLNKKIVPMVKLYGNLNRIE